MRSSRRLAVCPASACRPLVAVSHFHSLLIAFFLTWLRLCACEKHKNTDQGGELRIPSHRRRRTSKKNCSPPFLAFRHAESRCFYEVESGEFFKG